MQPCEHLKENLTLYIYGELDPAGDREVENHLAACEACRHEHRQLTSVLAKVRQTEEIPELSPQAGRAMAADISRKLAAGHRLRRWWPLPDIMPARLVPAAAIAAALLVSVAVLGNLDLNQTTGSAPVSMTQDEELMLSDKDLEILDNLELLKDMEAIQKLSRVVDASSENDLQWDMENDTRGMKQDGYGHGLA